MPRWRDESPFVGFERLLREMYHRPIRHESVRIRIVREATQLCARAMMELDIYAPAPLRTFIKNCVEDVDLYCSVLAESGYVDDVDECKEIIERAYELLFKSKSK